MLGDKSKMGYQSKLASTTLLISDFKKTLDMKVESCSAAIERALFHNYSVTGDIMQEKLQDLYQTLDRICE